ncbi:MAG: hypothetical protein KF851_17160 [Pirellulaceae bacterium]|nr:hypothetical protein [Pirellulaceae bacterium]
MFLKRCRLITLTVLAIFLAGGTSAVAQSGEQEEFLIVAYNVENLFDIDGISLFEDYRAEQYKPLHLLRKLQNTAAVLATMQDGRGPEIILFQELEGDQTPSKRPHNYAAILKKYADVSLEQMLLTEPISDDIRDLPAEAFLLKALQEAGLDSYEVGIAEYRPDPVRTVAHVNATFSRFPIVETRTHHSDGARGTLEVVHKIGGYRLHTFNNHWKSGASDPEAEKIRLGNARVVRDRLASIVSENPAADIVLGGDFNSQYNQRQSNPAMASTALNDVLGAHGDEAAMVAGKAGILYNLWYELPEDDRGSDVYRDRWGTLMQLIVSRGLYDCHGIQYRDNSFGVLAIEGLNAQHGTKMPIRWAFADGDGSGYSDHLPVYAKFRVVKDKAPRRFVELENPSNETVQAKEPRKVDYGLALKMELPKINNLQSDDEIKNLQKLGHLFRIEAKVSGDKPFRVKVFEDEYNLWAFDVEMRKKVYERFKVSDSMDFVGELGVHNGNWQFVIRDLEWLTPPPVEKMP